MIAVEKLDSLASNPDRRRTADRLTDEVAFAIIRAYQRGVTVKEILEVTGQVQGSFAAAVGQWALQRCKCAKGRK